MRQRRSKQGFTIIEVMMALAVIAIGATAVVGMQVMVMRSNMHARNTTTATSIAQKWIERLKTDALSWRTSGDLSATTYLQDVGTPNTWLAPDAVSATESRGFDHWGRDFEFGSRDDSDLRFCASYRLNYVHVGQAIRADVRVFWETDYESGALSQARAGEDLVTQHGQCADSLSPDPPFGDADSPYHAVYASTVIRLNPRTDQ